MRRVVLSFGLFCLLGLMRVPLVADEEAAVTYESPSDCQKCGNDCLEPKVLTLVSNGQARFSSASVQHNLTLERETVCVRYDGHSDDKKLHVSLTNDRSIPYWISIEESGQPVYQAYISPGDNLSEELLPISDRRYTFRVSVSRDYADELPVGVRFLMYRGAEESEDNDSYSSAFSVTIAPTL